MNQNEFIQNNSLARPDDLAFMLDYESWPSNRNNNQFHPFVVLPIKKYGKSGGQLAHCAMLVRTVAGTYYFVDQMFTSQFSAESMVPMTPESLVADGWLVD